MNVVRTTTLAIGASLIGSSLFIVLTKPDALSLTILAMGIISLLHGTGFLQEYIIGKFLRFWRTKKLVIGVINDLPWSEEETHPWAWSKMKPDEWISKLNNLIKKNKLNAKVKTINITKPWTRWFLDKYFLILNPYGSVYPEVNIKELTVWNSILYYVLHGGKFVNVADIPFYYAYDPKRKIRYEMVKYFHQYVPIYQRSSNDVWYPVAGIPLSLGPYLETPFLSELRVNIINTEERRDGKISPISPSLKFKSSSDELDSVAINRGIVVGKHVESLVEEIEWQGKLITPFCSIYFGKGKFIVSLIFLEYDKQSEDIREKITNLQCDLIIEEVRNALKNLKQQRLSYNTGYMAHSVRSNLVLPKLHIAQNVIHNCQIKG